MLCAVRGLPAATQFVHFREYGAAGFDRLRHVIVSSGPGVEPVKIDAQSECGGTSLLP